MFTASSLDPYLQEEQAVYFIQVMLSLTCDGSSKVEAKKMSVRKMLLPLHFIIGRIG